MYHIFTDGSSSRQRKSIGSAYAIFDKNKELIKSYNLGFNDAQGRTGIAELIAVYCVLNEILDNSKFDNKQIVIYSDSQYVVKELTIWFKNQMVKNFFETKNKDLIIYLLYCLFLIKESKKCNLEFKWIRGHQQENSFEASGNNLVDNLAVSAHTKDVVDLKNVQELENQLKDFNQKEKILQEIKDYYLK